MEHNKFVYGPIIIHGTTIYVIHMTPGENRDKTKIEMKYYKDTSPIFDYMLEERRNDNTRYRDPSKTDWSQYIVDIKNAKATYEDLMLQTIDKFNEMMKKYDATPDIVRENEIKPGKEAETIKRILTDPWSVVRRFRQIETTDEGKKARQKSLANS